MNDELLIELVRHHSVIYDLSHPKYMDNTFKLNIWSEIGKAIKADVLSCKARWNNIRDNYRKSLKKTTTKRKQGKNAKKIKLYKYSEQLSFLKKYFDEKETKGNIESQEDQEDKQEHEEQNKDEVENRKDDAEEPNISDINEDLQSQPSSIPIRKNSFEAPTTSTIKISTKKRAAFQQTASSKLMEYLMYKNENEATSSTSQHPVDAFLAGVAPTLKTFNPYYLNLAKSEIFATVQKYEMKMLMEQYSYQGRGRSDQNFTPNMTPYSAHYSRTPSSDSTPLPSPTETLNNEKQVLSPSTAIPKLHQ